jgi:Spy/CpxP family protein refolding chaperone
MTESATVNSTAAGKARGLKRLAAGVVIAVTASIGLTALAQPMPGGHHGGFGGPGMFMGSPEHIGRAVDHVLDGVNATDAQRTQIKQIVTQAAADLKAQRDAGRALHERSMQIFTAPTVDAAAAESVRQQMLTQHDTASRRVLQAMLDISRVLTPEQRAKLAERMNERHKRMEERMQRMQRDGK